MREKVVPSVDLVGLRRVRLREFGVRFAFGFAISVAAALLAARFGARFGGMFLGFPAILPASLTLIQGHHSERVAGINATGAIAGGLALVAFAAVGAWSLDRLGLGAGLLLAGLAWLVVAAAVYFGAVQLRPAADLVRPRSKQ